MPLFDGLELDALQHGLNEGQLEAVLSPIERPTLVIAGAGSGKTTTLTRRIRYLVASGIEPADIVSMTFTKKAAAEFAERLAGTPAADVATGTIHSFAYARLRHWLAEAGLDLPALVQHPKQVIKRLRGRPADGFDEALPDFPAELDVSVVLKLIDHWQDELATPEEALRSAEEWEEAWSARMFRAYTAWKRRTNRIDFGDMVGRAIDIYQDVTGALEADRRLHPYALVDELQDTNTAQWRLIELLWTGTPLFGVADVRQAIYEWRGARPGQVLGFHRMWPNVNRVTLDLNYRTTELILEPAQRLIDGTVEAQSSGRMRAVRRGGRNPELWTPADTNAEADAVVNLAGSMLSEGFHKPGDLAVVYRTNAQSAPLEDALARAGLPYQVVGSKGFWARREIVQLLAYLRTAIEPFDADAYQTAIGAPARFLGRAFVEAATAAAHEADISIAEAGAQLRGYGKRSLTTSQRAAAEDFLGLIYRIEKMPPRPALELVISATGFRQWLSSSEGSSEEADDNRLEALEALLDRSTEFGTHREIILHADKQASKSSGSAKRDPMRIQLLTIHRAKGLEWPTVVVAGFVEELLPHAKGELDEERRLAYVAMTRPRDRLILSAPQHTHKGEAGPSGFLIDAGIITPAQTLGAAI